MQGIIFDIETNGLLPECTKIHCIAMKDTVGGEVRSFGGHTDEQVRGCLSHLEDAPLLIGHNIKRFDIRAIQKVYPAFKPRGVVRDTLTLSQLIWPDIKPNDYAYIRKNPHFPKNMIGRHGLKAWGYRLGLNKGTFGETSDWQQWSPEMQKYCEQDVLVTEQLKKLIDSKRYSEEAIQLEHDFLDMLIWQEENGFPFDEEGAKKLYAELCAERFMLDRKIGCFQYPPFKTITKFTPKRDNKRLGYKRGETIDKVRLVEFNPTSRTHIAEVLMKTRAWNPSEFTETGKPAVTEEVLDSLRIKPENPDGWYECNMFHRYFEIDKIIGMLAEGKKAWLKLVRNGRIHGEVIGNGTVTSRCAHRNPNLGQIPKEGDIGQRCRALFTTIPGYKLVGTDASGVQLRMLAHYMARYDNGAYVIIVTTGDVHTVNQKAAGLDTRPEAKTFIYAFCFGAGDELLGGIALKEHEIQELVSNPKHRKRWEYAVKSLQKKNRKPLPKDIATIIKGGLLKKQFLDNLPALKLLQEALKEKVKAKGYIVGLDGRHLPIRSAHTAISSLLQGAEAVLMKKALVMRHQHFLATGAVHKRDICQVAMVHDEVQDLVREGMEKEIGEFTVKCIEDAGKYFKLKCPTTGEWGAGNNWQETH